MWQDVGPKFAVYTKSINLVVCVSVSDVLSVCVAVITHGTGPLLDQQRSAGHVTWSCDHMI